MDKIDSKLEMAKWIFENQLGWNAAVEIKTGVIVTLNLAVISGLASLFIEVDKPTIAQYWLSGIALICPIVALCLAAKSVSPQLSGPAESLLYFGRISEKDRQVYVEEFERASESDLLTDVLDQTHRNAEIVRSKYLHIRRAINWSFIGIFPWCVAVVGLCL